MAIKLRVPKARQGDDVTKLWRHVNALIDFAEQQQIEIEAIKSKTLRKRLLDTLSGELTIRGEYSPLITYKLYDVLAITTGANAGTYVWIYSEPGSGIHPTTGAPYWMQLPMGTVGAWL
jgi:hypothetical protein